MAYFNDKYKKARLDQSPYLFHFIKGNNPYPYETLNKILDEKKLISSNNRICFTASPLTSITKFFDEKCSSTGSPMYHPFGIGFSRDILVRNYKARNVIYVDNEEFHRIPEDLRWRTDILNVDNYDFEYLREWRIQGETFDFSDIDYEDIVVVAPNKDILNSLVIGYEWIFNPIVNSEGYVEPDWDESWKRRWKGIAIESIKDAYHSDYVMRKVIDLQVADQDMFEELFGRSLFVCKNK